MKSIAYVIVSMLAFLPACGENAKAGETGGDSGAKSVMNQLGEAAGQVAAFDKLKGTLESLKSTLDGVTDGATAEKAKSTLEGIVGKLTEQMGALAKTGALTDNLAGVKDTLVKGAMEQVTKLIGNADVQKAIGPALDKLKAALGG